MRVKRIYGGLNIEFEGQNFINFAILDRACDECLGKEEGCLGCEECEKPWNEYYQILRYDLKGNEKVTYEKDRNEAACQLLRMLQAYIDTKEDKKDVLWESDFQKRRRKRSETPEHPDHKA